MLSSALLPPQDLRAQQDSSRGVVCSAQASWLSPEGAASGSPGSGIPQPYSCTVGYCNRKTSLERALEEHLSGKEQFQVEDREPRLAPNCLLSPSTESLWVRSRAKQGWRQTWGNT
jgi:hypothetical protein